MLLVLLAAGCATYAPDPVDTHQVLDSFDRVSASSVASVATAFDPADGFTAVEAAAVAVHLHPGLRALRAEVGVARAVLVQAGLLPDPTIGWRAGDVIADFITEGKSTAASYIDGAFLSWDVPRPGEIDAREGIARARVDWARAALLAAEWRLARDVQRAWIRLAAAHAGLQLNDAQAAVARSTREVVSQARRAGRVSALQLTLVEVARARVETARPRLRQEAAEASHSLLALMGLPPTTPLTLQDPGSALYAPGGRDESPDALTELALARRPDLREMEARYQQAEETLRYEVARQWPQISIGSGIGIQLPIFSRFNGPAIETAQRSRNAARERLAAAVYEVRSSIHLAHATWVEADARVTSLREELLPALEEAVRLAELARAAGTASPLEILSAQAQLLEVQVELLDARARRAAARLDLDAAAGALAVPHGPIPEAAEEHSDED